MTDTTMKLPLVIRLFGCDETSWVFQTNGLFCSSSFEQKKNKSAIKTKIKLQLLKIDFEIATMNALSYIKKTFRKICSTYDTNTK